MVGTRHCSFEGCLKPVRAKGFCNGHYLQHRTGKPLTALRTASTEAMSSRPCAFTGCANTAVSRGLCQPHAKQERQGTPLRPLRHIRPEVLRADGRGNKWCSYCQKYCPPEDFGLLRGKPRSRCAVCERAAKHHITRERFDALLREQNGVCGLCQQEAKRLLIDHNHNCCPGTYSCGACVRKLLCDNCNLGLGAFKDSPGLLQAAIDYVKEHDAR